MPKGRIFTIGLWSKMLADIMLLVITVFGVGINELGATPKLHFIMAPIHVCIGIL